MKQILIFLSIFLSSLSITTTGQCIDNAGHIMGDIDSIHTHDCEWFIDTVDVKVGRVRYVGEEYVVYPESCDTLFYQCVRCDSNIVQPSQSIKRYVRDVASMLNPEPEVSYKVLTFLLDYDADTTFTMTILQNTFGKTITIDNPFENGTNFRLSCDGCFTDNVDKIWIQRQYLSVGDNCYWGFDINYTPTEDEIIIASDNCNGFGVAKMPFELRVYP